MLYYLYKIVIDYCCGNKPHRFDRIKKQINEDVKGLTEEELSCLRSSLTTRLKKCENKTYCC